MRVYIGWKSRLTLVVGQYERIHIYTDARALAQKHTRTRYRRGEWAENTMHAISRHRGLIPNQNPSLPG